MRLMRLIRGLVALAVLAALLGGAPTVLWVVGRPFLPTRLPTVDDVTAALVRPDDGTLLIGLLVVVGWSVWATLAASVIGEVINRCRTSRRAHCTSPVALWPSRAVAALLVGWIVTAFATPPATVTAPATPVASEPVVHVSNRSKDPREPSEHRREHVVLPRDTLWDIAAAELGDPLRWQEILDLNRGHPQADGARLGDDTVLHVGWTLILPDTPTPDRIQVHRGDTLSGLADRYLGDPDRYPELYDNNTSRVQPDRRRLADPDQRHADLIPGYIIDAAHELVSVILSRTALDNPAEYSDLAIARAAAATAQTVDPDRTSDRPFTDLMRIAHAAGDLDEMRRHAELLLEVPRCSRTTIQ